MTLMFLWDILRLYAMGLRIDGGVHLLEIPLLWASIYFPRVLDSHTFAMVQFMP